MQGGGRGQGGGVPFYLGEKDEPVILKNKIVNKWDGIDFRT